MLEVWKQFVDLTGTFKCVKIRGTPALKLLTINKMFSEVDVVIIFTVRFHKHVLGADLEF